MGRVVRRAKEMMHGWNLFRDSPQDAGYSSGGMTMSPRSNRAPARFYNDRSILGSIYTRMAVDFSSVEFFHAKTDDAGVAIEIVRDSLHDCLTLDPNIDQTAQALKQDFALTLFEQGHAVLAPIDANMDPLESASYDIKQLRVGRVVGWYPRKVTIEVYDDRDVDENGEPVGGGITKQVTVRKQDVCIMENPFYGVMNEPNGLLMRLQRKLAILDALDEAAGSGKLDIIFQLPYSTRMDSRKKEAEQRRDALAEQLKDDELGIGYIDVTEKVIQLNRPVTNKLLEQIEYLYAAVYTQLGLTAEIMNGTADQDAINRYYDRTIEPLANGLALEIKRKFLTKTARTQNHSIEIYRDPLKLIPISELAEIVDKVLRNAAVTANELRPKIGFMPSKDPRANELANPNMPVDDQPGKQQVSPSDPTPPPKEVTDGAGLPGDGDAEEG